MDERVKSKHDEDLVFAVDPRGHLVTVPKSFPMEGAGGKRSKGFRWATAGEVPPELVAPPKLADQATEVAPVEPIDIPLEQEPSSGIIHGGEPADAEQPAPEVAPVE